MGTLKTGLFIICTEIICMPKRPKGFLLINFMRKHLIKILIMYHICYFFYLLPFKYHTLKR